VSDHFLRHLDVCCSVIFRARRKSLKDELLHLDSMLLLE
jgi:hypothetical protein